jgi:hypothetical protein
VGVVIYREIGGILCILGLIVMALTFRGEGTVDDGPDLLYSEPCCEPDYQDGRYVHSEGCTRLESNYKKEEGE